MKIYITVIFFLFSTFIIAQREFSDLIKTVSQNINVNLDSCDFELISEEILPYSKDKSVVIIPELIDVKYEGEKINIIHLIIVNNKNNRILNTYTDTLASEPENWLYDITINTEPYNSIKGFGMKYRTQNSNSTSVSNDKETISIFITSNDTLQIVINKLEVYSYEGTSYTFDEFSEVSASSYRKNIILDSNKTNGFNNLIIKESGYDLEESQDEEFTRKEISNKIDTLKFNGEIYTTLPFNITSQIKEIYPDSINYLNFNKKNEKSFNNDGDTYFNKFNQFNEDGEALVINIDSLNKEEKRIYKDFFGISEMELSERGYWGIFYVRDNGYFPKIKASSSLKQQGNINYEAENIYDWNYKNVWAEGVSGYGIGEYIIFHDGPYIDDDLKVIISNGYVKSEAAWKNNSRVKKLKLYCAGIPFAILNLEDSRSEQIFKFPELPASYDEWELKFEILDIYKGEKYDDTVISEIYFKSRYSFR